MKGTSEFNIQAAMDILAEVFFDDTTLLSHVGAEVMHAEPVSLLLSWQCRGTGELFTHHTVCPLLCHSLAKELGPGQAVAEDAA